MKPFKDRSFNVAEGRKVKRTRFPISVFWICLGTCCLMAGIHVGLIVAMREIKVSDILQTHLMLLYWFIVAAGMTLFIKARMERTYEQPLRRISDATRKVAKGDFSVYIEPTHRPDKLDYLDLMILDLNKMIEELGSIETLKTDFFSNVSHEIKAPLAVIQSNVELMERPGRTEEEYRECAKNIHRATARLSSLIGNMLKLNKLEKQTISPMPVRYELCRQLCDCALQFEKVWEEKAIEFDADMEDEVYIEADEGLLELVWTNLLSNAFKFTGSGGAVRLGERRENGKIAVSVADTGCGMDEKTISRIFDKFYQGDTSHAAEGNGLGLALVKRILELSDGEIEVESKPGSGSTFKVLLPAVENSETEESI